MLGRLTQEVGAPAAVLVDALVTASGTDCRSHRCWIDSPVKRQHGADVTRRPGLAIVRLSFPLVFCTLPSFVLLAIVPVLVTALSSLPRP